MRSQGRLLPSLERMIHPDRGEHLAKKKVHEEGTYNILPSPAVGEVGSVNARKAKTSGSKYKGLFDIWESSTRLVTEEVRGGKKKV